MTVVADRTTVDGAVSPSDETKLPTDATLLPLFDGELLVSRSHAVFCRVPPEELEAMRGVLLGERPLSSLGEALRDDLELHGFFGEPRATEDDPPSVQIQLTNSCNLACSYCCTNSGAPRRAEVSYEQIRRVVEQVGEAFADGGGRVALLGGEPLAVPWALDIAEQVLDLGLDLTIFTNGTPLREPALARRTAALIERGAQVRVSLAGVSRELCDELSQTARFDAALAGIAQLAAAGGQITVDLMLLPQHVDVTVEQLPALRKRLPPDTPIALGLLYLSGREQGEHLFGSRIEMERALDRIAFEAGELIAAPKRAPVTYRREGCGCAMGHHLHVRSDGVLFSCFKMEEQVGDLAAGDFLSAWKALQGSPHPASALSTCAECPLATLCGGGCRSDNFLYTGDGDLPVCDSWRVRVISELLAEDQVTAVDWPIHHLLDEAHRRGIEAPPQITPRGTSRHLTDTE